MFLRHDSINFSSDGNLTWGTIKIVIATSKIVRLLFSELHCNIILKTPQLFINAVNILDPKYTNYYFFNVLISNNCVIKAQAIWLTLYTNITFC